jgi:hypothetical protein
MPHAGRKKESTRDWSWKSGYVIGRRTRIAPKRGVVVGGGGNKYRLEHTTCNVGRVTKPQIFGARIRSAGARISAVVTIAT